MSALAYALAVIVVVAGGIIGAIIYALREQPDGDDDPPAEADATDAAPVEAAGGDAETTDRPVKEQSTIGRLTAAVVTSLPKTEKGVRETLHEELAARGRPTKPYSAVGRAMAGIIASIPKPLLKVRGTLFKRLLVKSAKNYHKVGGGDALGLIAEPGQNLDVRPIKYRAPKECEDGERPGWVEKGGDKVWHAGAEGRVVDYLGDTPIVALERDGHVEAGWLKPRIGQAIELDNYDGVYVNPEITGQLLTDPQTSLNANANGTPPEASALADGGENILNLDVEDIGNYAGAEVVNLDSGTGYDGMRIDFRKASQWAFETTATEQMQMQEERGRLMGMLAGDNGPGAFKLLLLAGGIILGALFIIEVLPILLNGGGGGGGGINPLTVALGGV